MNVELKVFIKTLRINSRKTLIHDTAYFKES